MPSANAELARVHATNAAGGVAEEAVFNQAFRVIAEAEALSLGTETSAS